MPKRLTRAIISTHGDDYLLHLEDEEGGAFDVIVSFEQLDLLGEDIDRRLDADDQEVTIPPLSDR